MPGEQAMLGGEAGDAEDLDGLIGDQRREDGGRIPWGVQRHGGHVDDAPVAVAQRAVGADEFAHAVAACARPVREDDSFNMVDSFQCGRGPESGARDERRRRRDAVAAEGVEFCFQGTDREPDALARARQVVERPAVAQEQGDGDQPWELAGGQHGRWGRRAIELVGDVEFVEESGERAARPRETVCAIGEFLQNVAAAVSSPVLRPGRAQASRCVAVSLVTRRRTERSRMADTSGRAPGSGSEGGHLRDGLSRGAGEGRGVRQRPL